MNAGAAYPVLQWAVPIHPTVSELIPTVLGDLKRISDGQEGGTAAIPQLTEP